MKEAAGELNMTAITILAVGAIGAFFYLVLWPGIKQGLENNTRCTQATCGDCNTTTGRKDCTFYNENNELEDIVCPCRD